MTEIGVTVVPEIKFSVFKSLKLRILSAVFILPIVIVIIWNGSWSFVGFLAFLSFIAVSEWNKLIGLNLVNARKRIPLIPPSLTSVSILIVGVFGYPLGVIMLLLACSTNLMIARVERCSRLLAMLGPAYVFLPCCCLIWLREFPIYGVHMVFWFLLVVCTTDTCAYIFGTIMKGPKLAPKISPSKTCSGLVSGVFCATAVGVFVGQYIFDFENILGGGKWVVVLALLVALFAQLGDLGESWLKRQANVKDSGILIPGHGGLLDRVDGFMISAPLMATFISCLPESMFSS